MKSLPQITAGHTCVSREKTEWMAGWRYIEEEPHYTRGILKEAQLHFQQEQTKVTRETRKTKNGTGKAWSTYVPS